MQSKHLPYLRLDIIATAWYKKGDATPYEY